MAPTSSAWEARSPVALLAWIVEKFWSWSDCDGHPENVLTRDEIDADVVANERRIAEETAKEEGKPEAALPKIVEGRVNGFFKENVLLDQPFAKDSKKSVGKVLEEAGASATQFARFRVGS